MKSILSCLALAACGGSSAPPPPPAPIVDSLTPQAGLWGTEVTIDGANFGSVPGTSSVGFEGPIGANGFVVDMWGDTAITGRIAFPATGNIDVHTDGGSALAGTFATTEPWMPSSALDVTELVAELVLSTGDVAALYQEYELTSGPTLAVFSGSDAGAYSLEDLASPLIAQLAEADDNTPEVIATKLDNTVVVLTALNASVTTTATGLTGNVIAAARDATGLYTWIATASGLERARPGTPWTVDRGPFVTAYPPLAGAIAADGTLWITESEPAPSSMAYVALQILAPLDTDFEAVELADPTSYANAISQAQIVLAGDGIHALVQATATAGSTPTALTPRLRTAAATWSDAPAVTGLVQYGFIGTALAAIVNDPQAKSTSLVPDVTMPSGAMVIPVWPTQAQGFVVDSAGQSYPLVTNGDVSYALAPPS